MPRGTGPRPHRVGVEEVSNGSFVDNTLEVIYSRK
jgi:hypothetical protein